MNSKRKAFVFLIIFFVVASAYFWRENTKRKEIFFLEQKAKQELDLAEKLYSKGNFDKAGLVFIDAAGFFEKAGNVLKTSYCYNSAGLCFKKTGHDAIALENYRKSLLVAEKIRDKKLKIKRQAAALYNIAVVFDSLKFYKKALSFYLKAQKNYELLGMLNDYYYSKVDIAIVYRKLGQLNRAIELQRSAYNFFKKSPDKYYLCLTANNLAYSYMKKGDFRKSQLFHNEALLIAKSNSFNDMLPYIYSGMGELYFSIGNYDKSLYYQKLAEKLADNDDLDLREYILNAFSKLYLARGEKKKAGYYLKSYNQLLAQRYNTKIFERVEQIIGFMEKERHKEKLMLLEKEKKIRNMIKYLFMVAFFTAVVFVSFLGYRYSVKKRINKYLDMLARKDPLTNLSNRRDILERIEREKARFYRNKKEFSVAICDIDDFKKVNDRYGHGAGDEVLKRIAEIFKENLRKTDGVARWGGEEFLFLFPETSLFVACKVVEKLRTLVEQCDFVFSGKKVKVTVTFGVCVFDGSFSVEDVIKLADEALYKGKNSGKNRVERCKGKD